MSVFGDRLRQERLSRNLSMKQLADMAGISSQSQIFHYEHGHRDPSLESAVRLADALAVKLDWLSGRQETRR